MTEDQKYQGHLYREKPVKVVKKKSVSILEPNDNNALVPRNPTVEDEREGEVPPHVPTPPPAVDTRNQDSVFDYLVEDEDPNTPQIQFATEREEMFMKSSAPGVFNSRPTSRSGYRNKEEQLESKDYELNGFTYGAEPVNPRPLDLNASTITLDFMTPSAKVAKAKLDRNIPESAGHSRQNSNSEKKRKRAQTDDPNGDTVMADAPGTVVRSVVESANVPHSGLTGGIQRLSTDKNFSFPTSPISSPDPDPDGRALAKIKPVKPPKQTDLDPQSPLKRTRRTKEEDPNGLGISIKGRAGKVMSMINGALSTTNAEGAVGKSTSTSRQRRASSSDNQEKLNPVRPRDTDKRERKKHKVTRHNGTSSANVRMAPTKSSSSRRNGTASESASPDLSKSSRNGKSAQKQIEYHPSSHHQQSHSQPRATSTSRHRPVHSPSDSDDDRHRQDDPQAMVVFGAEERLRRKCDDFLAYISKGPSSSKGYSINKVLKRYHKDSEITRDTEKREEEKELWKGLRLKRNERGEVVVFFV